MLDCHAFKRRGSHAVVRRGCHALRRGRYPALLSMLRPRVRVMSVRGGDRRGGKKRSVVKHISGVIILVVSRRVTVVFLGRGGGRVIFLGIGGGRVCIKVFYDSYYHAFFLFRK
jgi:hypothetical protein